MTIQVEKTELDGVLLVKSSFFNDHRGKFISLYDQKDFEDNGIDILFLQDSMSYSTKNVLRGIHGDFVTWKLVCCTYGSLHCTVVNCWIEKYDFGKWQSFNLTAENGYQLLIPPGYGNSYLALEDSVCYYKQSTFYVPGRQFSYKWNDRKFNIDWPIDNPILSERDS